VIHIFGQMNIDNLSTVLQKLVKMGRNESWPCQPQQKVKLWNYVTFIWLTLVRLSMKPKTGLFLLAVSVGTKHQSTSKHQTWFSSDHKL